jgi:hypothetical protein
MRFNHPVGGLAVTNRPRKELDPRHKEKGVHTNIVVCYVKSKDIGYRVKKYLDTLANEMLHSLFQLYSCRCSLECRTSDPGYWRGQHGPNWLAGAYAIERASKIGDTADYTGLPGLDLNLDRNEVVAFKLDKGADFNTIASDLDNLGLDISKINK